MNFNTWISEGISYMNREEEKRYLRTQRSREDNHVDEKSGLLHLWKAICSSNLPLVVHQPQDLFILLAAFEQKPLPRGDFRALAAMVLRCTPRVYDTARLCKHHRCFKGNGFLKLFEEVEDKYEELLTNSTGNCRWAVPKVDFELEGQTAGLYSEPSDDSLVHEAGFDSLVIAQLFAYLRAVSAPQLLEIGANQLQVLGDMYLDLDKAIVTAVPIVVEPERPLKDADSNMRPKPNPDRCRIVVASVSDPTRSTSPIWARYLTGSRVLAAPGAGFILILALAFLAARHRGG